MGFRAQGSGFRVQGLGLRLGVTVLGCSVGFGVQGFGHRDEHSGLRVFLDRSGPLTGTVAREEYRCMANIFSVVWLHFFGVRFKSTESLESRALAPLGFKALRVLRFGMFRSMGSEFQVRRMAQTSVNLLACQNCSTNASLRPKCAQCVSRHKYFPMLVWCMFV